MEASPPFSFFHPFLIGVNTSQSFLNGSPPPFFLEGGGGLRGSKQDVKNFDTLYKIKEFGHETAHSFMLEEALITK